MKFFFPDSHDLVDPTFDFQTERRTYSGSRQLSQQYAHEIFPNPPYDGMLLSMAVVGGWNKSLRYTPSQIRNLKFEGAHEFFRFNNEPGIRNLEIMGDCGSFTYKDEYIPPFTVSEVAEFYSECKFDYGLSLDHIIHGFEIDSNLISNENLIEWKRRFELTMQYAWEFRKIHNVNNYKYDCIGVAQGWGPASYRDAVAALQKMGYDYIAIGGMVSLKSRDIIRSLEEIKTVRKPQTKLHLLGIARFTGVEQLMRYGVVSIDSTAPLKQAFKDANRNYHTLQGDYMAIRVPQVGENAQLRKKILAGEVDHDRARALERLCLRGLINYGNKSGNLRELMGNLKQYEEIHSLSAAKAEKYERTLIDRPWEKCSCAVCKSLGIHVVLLRGAERNRRRGFHNLYVLNNLLKIQSR